MNMILSRSAVPEQARRDKGIPKHHHDQAMFGRAVFLSHLVAKLSKKNFADDTPDTQAQERKTCNTLFEAISVLEEFREDGKEKERQSEDEGKVKPQEKNDGREEQHSNGSAEGTGYDRTDW